MFCRKCGEENPNNAVYCRNCGEKLIEEVKKAEVIEAPKSNQQQTSSSTTNKTSEGGSDTLTCCLCLIGIFIIFAIIGAL